MSDVTSSFSQAPVAKAQDPRKDPYKIEETHWGYIVRATADAGRSIAVAQTISMLIGALLLAAAIGLWFLPAITFGADALFMRFFATIMFAGLSAFFLWYASRGVQSEIQIDNSRGEIREVIRNKTGKLTLLGSYGFDAVSGVYLEPGETKAETNLVLRYRNTGGCLVIAVGHENDLTHLRDRIGRDVVVGSETETAPQPAA